MRLLLDTHALYWWLIDPARLGSGAHGAVADPHNQVFVSAVSTWEMAIKVSLGKLKLPPHLLDWLPGAISADNLEPLAVSLEHTLAVEHLPPYHRDPFDRLLIAQATVEDLRIVTADAVIERYPVRVLRASG